MNKQTRGLIAFVIVALLFLLVAALILSSVTYYEDQSARVFGHSVCLGDYCGGLFNPEVLQSHDLADGYLVIGVYQDYRDGGQVTCYHDISICIFPG